MGKRGGRHTPKSMRERRFAEDCQYGDEVEWATPPLLKHGPVLIGAPSRHGIVSAFIGPKPVRAMVRFIVDGREGEPQLVVPGQPLRVLRGNA